MILEEKVIIRPNGYQEYWRSKGYLVNGSKPIEVRVEDLPKRSRARITAICDVEGCNCAKEISYASYSMTVEKNGFYRCFQCGNKAKKQVFLEKYGVDNPAKTEEVKRKIEQTNLERYGARNNFEREDFLQVKKEACLRKFGVEHQLQSPEIQDKIKQTNLEKYGVEQVLQSKEIQEKVRQTNLEKYGYECVLQSPEIIKKIAQTNIERYGNVCPTCNPEIKAKMEKTNLERYGATNPFSNPEIQHKIKKALYDNNSQYCSQQQSYICELYKGELNFPILMYNADILVDNIDVEYDGGGHKLQVKYGDITEEDFLRREIIRTKRIEQQGYRIVRIISDKDFLPSDKILLQMLSDAKKYFSTTNHHWVEYYIDKSLVRNAEHKDGIFYNFGELRKIKKCMIKL